MMEKIEQILKECFERHPCYPNATGWHKKKDVSFKDAMECLERIDKICRCSSEG